MTDRGETNMTVKGHVWCSSGHGVVNRIHGLFGLAPLTLSVSLRYRHDQKVSVKGNWTSDMVVMLIFFKDLFDNVPHLDFCFREDVCGKVII